MDPLVIATWTLVAVTAVYVILTWYLVKETHRQTSRPIYAELIDFLTRLIAQSDERIRLLKTGNYDWGFKTFEQVSVEESIETRAKVATLPPEKLVKKIEYSVFPVI